jgi:hypothetical protein
MMSTQRKWKLTWSYGYAGTSGSEVIDLIDDWGYSEEQLAEATDEELEKEVNTFCWEQAIQQVESCAEPVD